MDQDFIYLDLLSVSILATGFIAEWIKTS